MSNQGISWTLDTRELDRIVANCDKSRDQIIRRLAFEIEGDAKRNAPYDTTALRNSIYTVTANEDNYQQASSAAQEKRPGVQTEKYLSRTVNRLILFGSIVLGIVAILPFVAEYLLYHIAGVTGT